MKFINIDIDQLLNIAEKKKIICFGAGKRLVSFFESFEKYELKNKIYCIVDNDEKKNETVVNIADTSLKVYSFRRFQKMDIQDYVILITSSYVCEIMEQLNADRAFDDIYGCCSDLILEMTRQKEEENRYYPQSFRIYDTPHIPKKIHYCWFGGNEIPEQNRIWMESWKKYCPDYEIIEWNESNYDITKNQYMYEAYKAKKWGFVPDFARLDIIYNHGGIYLDTDVEIVKSLDDLLYQDAFAGIDSSRKVSLGLGFGAVPHFSFIRELLEDYNKILFDKNNMVAAPALNEKVFRLHHFVNDGSYQQLDGMTIYPEKVLAAKNNTTGIISPTENTYAIHHYDGSWLNEDIKMQWEKMQTLYHEVVSGSYQTEHYC